MDALILNKSFAYAQILVEICELMRRFSLFQQADSILRTEGFL